MPIVRSALRHTALALILVALPACGGAPPPPPAPKAEAPAPPPQPRVAVELEKVLGCKWTDEDGFDPECAEYKAFDEASDLLDEDENKASKDLLPLLESSDEKVRWLALGKLPGGSASLFRKADEAGRLLSQAEKETSKRVLDRIGSAVAMIDVDGTELFGRVEKLAKESPSLELRKAIYRNLLRSNGKSKKAQELVLAGLTADDKDLRYVALMGLGEAEKESPEAICGAYVKSLDDASGDVVGLAAQKLGYVGACAAQIDTLLAFAKKRAKAGDVKEWLIPNALLNLCRNEATTEAQKKEATSVAKELAKGKNDDSVRSNALDAVMQCDPKGLNFVRIYANDKAASVKDAAKKHIDAAKKKP